MRGWPWSELRIGRTSDIDAIQAAYEARLSRLSLSSPPDAFTRLAAARKDAMEDAAGKAVRRQCEPPPMRMARGEPHRLVSLVERALAKAARSPRLIAGAGFFILFVLMQVFNPPHEAPLPPASDGRDPQEAVRVVIPPDPLEDPALLARAEAVVPHLFGEGYGIDWVRARNSAFAGRLLSEAVRGNRESDLDNARSYLRTSVVRSRRELDPAGLRSASGMYLVWLRTAQAEGGDACRDVTGHSFFDGIPHLSEEDRLVEQGFARAWLTMADGAAIFGETSPPDQPIPPWAMDRVRERTGLAAPEVRAALADYADPRRCRVTIALVEAMLERSEDAPAALLSSL